MKAKIRHIMSPPALPPIAPTIPEPLSHAPPNPQAAPMIIMPSTPRLSTPARSVTSSPMAAINSGVDAANTERMMASNSATGHLWRREDQAEPVENEGIAGEHVKQQDALKHLGDVERNFHRNLGLFAANEGECEEKTCN